MVSEKRAGHRCSSSHAAHCPLAVLPFLRRRRPLAQPLSRLVHRKPSSHYCTQQVGLVPACAYDPCPAHAPRPFPLASDAGLESKDRQIQNSSITLDRCTVMPYDGIFCRHPGASQWMTTRNGLDFSANLGTRGASLPSSTTLTSRTARFKKACICEGNCARHIFGMRRAMIEPVPRS